MLDRLERLVADVSQLNCQLVLLVGSNGKTEMLRALGRRIGVEPLILGIDLAKHLAAIPVGERAIEVGPLLRDVLSRSTPHQPILLDNLEVLFEQSLLVNPLELLKKFANGRAIIAVWPGHFADGHLIYADIGHPEHRAYVAEGLAVLEI